MTITRKFAAVLLAATMLASPVMARAASLADAPYVSLDTEDYVCPEKLSSQEAVVKELARFTLWAYDLGYKTIRQQVTFRDGFLERHHCYETLLHIVRSADPHPDHATVPLCSFTPGTRPSDGYHSCYSTDEGNYAFRLWCDQMKGEIVDDNGGSCHYEFYRTTTPPINILYMTEPAHLRGGLLPTMTPEMSAAVLENTLSLMKK